MYVEVTLQLVAKSRQNNQHNHTQQYAQSGKPCGRQGMSWATDKADHKLAVKKLSN